MSSLSSIARKQKKNCYSVQNAPQEYGEGDSHGKK